MVIVKLVRKEECKMRSRTRYQQPQYINQVWSTKSNGVHLHIILIYFNSAQHRAGVANVSVLCSASIIVPSKWLKKNPAHPARDLAMWRAVISRDVLNSSVGRRRPGDSAQSHAGTVWKTGTCSVSAVTAQDNMSPCVTAWESLNRKRWRSVKRRRNARNGGLARGIP